MRVLALLAVCAWAAVSGQEFQGYYYPRPTPACVPEVLTVTNYATETLTHYFTEQNTVYLTDYLTSTVVNPVYLTSTEYAVSTVFVPEYLTATSTLVIQPTPVVQFSTVTVYSTVVAQGDFSGDAAPSNQYLPPAPEQPRALLESSGVAALPPPHNDYLPPVSAPTAPVGAPAGTGLGFQPSAGAFGNGNGYASNPLGVGVTAIPPSLGALPPYSDAEGYRYRRKS